MIPSDDDDDEEEFENLDNSNDGDNNDDDCFSSSFGHSNNRLSHVIYKKVMEKCHGRSES